MLKILFILLTFELSFIVVYIKVNNQVKRMSYSELQRLQEYRKRSHRDFMKPTFEKWKHQNFNLLWIMWYNKTDRTVLFNEYCWLLFNKKIIVEIDV